MKKKIESYQGAAGGWGAVKSVANAVRKQMDSFWLAWVSAMASPHLMHLDMLQ